MTVKLRDYQIAGIDDILNAWKECKSVLFQMPTGTGKTTLFCEIARMFTSELYPDKKVLIITHRKELVEQAFNRLDIDFGLSTGRISASFNEQHSAPIQVASIRTLVLRSKHHKKDIFSLIIIDEAHHALASDYKKLWNFYPNSKFLGVTATPTRTNGEGFQDTFDKLILTPPVKWFIKNNHLSNIRYFVSHTPDLSNIKIKNTGDYDDTELSEVMQDNQVMADLVQSYRDFTPDKKIIIFAVNRAHSRKIVEKYNSSGFVAKSIDSLTHPDEREKTIADFKDNKFKILCNVNIFSEGFDCPDVDAVQLARPTKSLTLFLQQVGRCMRYHENKPYGIVLDNAGLWKEHGLPKKDRTWSLYGTDKTIIVPQEAIIGIKEISTREDNEPQESKGIRLVEVDEKDNINPENIISYNNIEKNFIDKKITTMRERIEALIDEIQELEESKINLKSEKAIKLIDKEISDLQSELLELQAKLQPKRFDQVIELIIGKCQELINNNEIFVDGDKDTFLARFIEPSLNSNVNGFRETVVVKSENSRPANDRRTSGEAKTPRAGNKKLKVTFQKNGKVYQERLPIDTLIKSILEIGIDRVRVLPLSDGAPVISDKANNPNVQKVYKSIPNTPFFIIDNNSTAAKKDCLEKIANLLKVEIKVETIPE